LDLVVVLLETNLCLNYKHGSSQCNSFVRNTNISLVTETPFWYPSETTTDTIAPDDEIDSNYCDSDINCISTRIEDLVDANIESRATAMGVNVLAKRYFKLINSHPNFPATNYSNNYDVSTTIMAPAGKGIQISAVYFEL